MNNRVNSRCRCGETFPPFTEGPRRARSRRPRLVLLIVLAAVLGGCAGYHPQPLASQESAAAFASRTLR